MSDFSSARAVASSNSPPSNQATRSKPILPPHAIAPEELASKVDEIHRGTSRMLQHPREHMTGQQTHIVSEHAEDETLDKVCDCMGIMTALPQRPRDGREGLRHALSEHVAGFIWTQPLGFRERPLKLVTSCPVGKIVETEFVDSG